ncbi:uncharacterized protein LOC120192621 [Hibiscus syriacus]|uniref:uncharacterized protein LOC120192621 n=1 Tax=Hibiscus syriacus TaxID=106335 RepID=UPI0019211FCC|nr:uncharacterized protein LOC120192621 [Hibiscus syriacus]
MKRRILQWIIFITLYISSDRAFISSSEAAVNDLKPLMKGRQLKSVFKDHGTRIKGLHEAIELEVVEREKEVIVDEKKKGGKGSYGGGDLPRPRARKGGANPLHPTPFALLALLLPTLFFF